MWTWLERTRVPEAAARLFKWRMGLATLAVLVVLVLWAYHWDGSGFGESFGKPKDPQGLRDYYPSKTLWDWMQLLLVPAVLAGAAAWLNWRQARREERGTDRREQDAVLDTYLTQIGTLLLHEKLGDPADQQAPGANEKAQYVARAQTTTAVRRLDSGRTAIMVRFLSEAQLIKIVDLRAATLAGADLSLADLTGASLGEASLRQADLSQTVLTGAILVRADLRSANLRTARLGGADLRLAMLQKADLTGADLTLATLPGADLTEANLTTATLARANLAGAVLRGATLSQANLAEAGLAGSNLTEANLTGASLIGANLTGASLAGTNLTGANLRAAVGTTRQQLAQAKSLHGATMPDGSIYT